MSTSTKNPEIFAVICVTYIKELAIMPAYKFTLLFRVLFVSLIISNCRQNTSVLPRDVVNSIEKRIDYGINPSIAIGVIDENGTHFFNFGKKSAQGLPVDEHTIYEIGSITKTIWPRVCWDTSSRCMQVSLMKT